MTEALDSLPDPPYYAVIFTSQKSSVDADEYAQVAARMCELAAQQPGYLGMTSLQGANGLGVTISYWTDMEAIAHWRTHAEHRVAQDQGRQTFYDEYRLEVCLVERQQQFTSAESPRPKEQVKESE